MALLFSRSIRTHLLQRLNTLLVFVVIIWLFLHVYNRTKRRQFLEKALKDYPETFSYDPVTDTDFFDTDTDQVDKSISIDEEVYKSLQDYDEKLEELEVKLTEEDESNKHISDGASMAQKDSIASQTAQGQPVPAILKPLPVLNGVLYDGRYEIPKPELLINISSNSDFERDLDLLKTPPIPFLPNYRSPCWFESASDPDEYFKNFFLLATDRSVRFMESYKQMKSILESRKTSVVGTAWRLRCLPAYYIPGISKCGSTDLSLALDLHPEVVKGDMKELKYWNRVRHPHSIKRYLAAVEQHPHLNSFPRPLNHFLQALDYSAEKTRSHHIPGQDLDDPPYHPMLIGDSTPSYMWDFDSWRHMSLNQGLDEPKYITAHYIKQVTPNAKLVIILRNPVDRLYSDFKGFQRHKQKSKEHFHNLAEKGLAVFKECLSKRTLRACIYDYDVNNRDDVLPVRVRVGIYYPMLKDWLDVFPREQIYIVRLDQYAEKRRQIVAEVVEFLGLRPMPEEKFVKIEEVGIRNQASRTMNSRVGGEMENATRTMLLEFYKPYNEMLAKLLNDQNYNWNE